MRNFLGSYPNVYYLCRSYKWTEATELWPEERSINFTEVTLHRRSKKQTGFVFRNMTNVYSLHMTKPLTCWHIDIVANCTMTVICRLNNIKRSSFQMMEHFNFFWIFYYNQDATTHENLCKVKVILQQFYSKQKIYKTTFNVPYKFSLENVNL